MYASDMVLVLVCMRRGQRASTCFVMCLDVVDLVVRCANWCIVCICLRQDHRRWYVMGLERKMDMSQSFGSIALDPVRHFCIVLL